MIFLIQYYYFNCNHNNESVFNKFKKIIVWLTQISHWIRTIDYNRVLTILLNMDPQV